MCDKLTNAIREKAKYLSGIYGVSENVAIIIMNTGICIKYDIDIENNLLDMAAKELKLRKEQ